MRSALLALALFASPALAQQAPFCVVSGAGSSCIHYSLQSCQSAARTFQGMCTANPNAMGQPQYRPMPQQPAAAPYPQPSLNLPNFSESWERGRQAGMQRRMAEQEHAARMALLKAQTEAAQRNAAPAKSSWADVAIAATQVAQSVAVYACKDESGNWQETRSPQVGCVVIRIE